MKNFKTFQLICNAKIESLIISLALQGLILMKQCCIHCSVLMKLKKNISALDGYEWRCVNKKCIKHRTSLSIRHGSWLKGVNAPLKTILQSICGISGNLRNCDIHEVVDIGRKVLIRLKGIIIDRMKTYFIQNPIKLGGRNIIVQLDETKLNFNVKSHRGRSSKICWALCIVDTSYRPSRGFATIVDDRSSKSLLPLIYSVVLPGSIIHSDEWPSYKKLGMSKVYKHDTVCHKKLFVDPFTGVHIQNVESYNNRIKMRIKMMYGLDLEQRKSFLIEFMFKERHTENCFGFY